MTLAQPANGDQVMAAGVVPRARPDCPDVTYLHTARGQLSWHIHRDDLDPGSCVAGREGSVPVKAGVPPVARHHSQHLPGDEGRRCRLVVTRKGGKQVLATLDPGVSDLLDTYTTQRPAWTGDGPVPLILDAEGRRLDRHDVTRMLRRLARAAGIPRPEKVTPHSLRASTITDQAGRGRPVTELQEISGHADIRTVMVYVDQHGRDERIAAMTGDLSRVLAAIPARFHTRRHTAR